MASQKTRGYNHVHIPRISANSHSPRPAIEVETAIQLTLNWRLGGTRHFKNCCWPYLAPRPTSTTLFCQQTKPRGQHKHTVYHYFLYSSLLQTKSWVYLNISRNIILHSTCYVVFYPQIEPGTEYSLDKQQNNYYWHC